MYGREELPVHLPRDPPEKIGDSFPPSAIPYLPMAGAAGHDASQWVKITKAAVIFPLSREGLSHCLEERTDKGHFERG
jgi:hypothetical protein